VEREGSVESVGECMECECEGGEVERRQGLKGGGR